MTKNQIPGAGGTGDSEEAKKSDNGRTLLPEIIAQSLAAQFPAAFARPVPLKVGIFADVLAATDITTEALTAFLLTWCGDPRYLAKIRAGKSRVDLQGRKAGTVTEQEEAYAKMRAQENFFAKRERR